MLKVHNRINRAEKTQSFFRGSSFFKLNNYLSEKRRLMLRLVLLLVSCVMLSAFGAEKIKVGFLNSSSTAAPETEGFKKFLPAFNAAFPYRYRCIGIKTSGKTTIKRIYVKLEKPNKKSPETGLDLGERLEIFTSNDNQQYKLLPKTAYKAQVAVTANGLDLTISGLAIKSKFIKLRCIRKKKYYVFIVNNKSDSIRVDFGAAAAVATKSKKVAATRVAANSPPAPTGNYTPIKGFKVGFENSNVAADPATEHVGAFGYGGSVAFPYAYRCLGIRRTDTQVVNRVVINLRKMNIKSKEKDSGIKNGLEIYVSNDNKHYKKLPRPYAIYVKRSDKFEKIYIDGLKIAEKYIKLRCIRKKLSYVFGYEKWQHCIQLYKLKKAEISDFSVPRYSGKKFSFKSVVRGKKKMLVALQVKKNDGKWQRVWSKKLGKDHEKISATIDLDGVSSGRKYLKLLVCDTDGMPAAEKIISFYLCKGIVKSNPGEGEVCFLKINKNNLQGKWVKKTASGSDGQKIIYYQSTAQGDKLMFNLPATGWCAVYAGIIGGDTRVQVESPRKILALEFWRKDILPAANALGEVLVDIKEFKENTELTLSRYRSAPLKIAYLRIQKLTSGQTALMQSEIKLVPRVIVHSDGFSGFFSGSLSSEAKLEKSVRQFKKASIYSYDWCLGTSTRFNIKTVKGSTLGEGDTSKYWRQGDKLAGRLVQKLITAGVSPLKVVAKEEKKIIYT
jgi:hypothetical protein